MKKLLPSLVVVMICSYIFASCSSKYRNASQEANDTTDFAAGMFELVLEGHSGNIAAGESVTYVAELINHTATTYDLAHGIPLIAIYVVPKGKDVTVVAGSTLVTTRLSANEKLSKQICVDYEQSGIYLVKAFASFSIDGTNYKIEADSMEVCVFDNDS